MQIPLRSGSEPEGRHTMFQSGLHQMVILYFELVGVRPSGFEQIGVGLYRVREEVVCSLEDLRC